MNPDYNNNRQNQPVKPFQNVPPTSSNSPHGETMGFDKYVAIALIVGLIAGFIIGQSVGSNDSDSDDENASSTQNIIFGENGATTTSITPRGSQGASVIGASMVGTDDEVEVSNQKTGNNVVISKLEISKPYWVAVRDSQSTTKVPYILGAKRMTAGTHNNLSIFVSRATQSGKKYDIVFYKDGATFNYSGSNLIMNGSKLAGSTFEAN